MGPDVSAVKLFTCKASLLVTDTMSSPKLSSNASALTDKYVLPSSVANCVLNLTRLRSSGDISIEMK